MTGDGDIYDNAEAFAHDAALLLVSVFFLNGSVDSIAKNITTCKNIIKGLLGRVKRFNPLEFLGVATSYEAIVDYEDFIKYVTEFVEADALNYIKSVVKETDINQNINSDILITSEVYDDICILKDQEIIWSTDPETGNEKKVWFGFA
ncbi:MAG: hypothetical protein J1E62_04535 [Lachnospiraceae bacterium]|nr:hypothetical protein [Lachnospiraceae bacterium]